MVEVDCHITVYRVAFKEAPSGTRLCVRSPYPHRRMVELRFGQDTIVEVAIEDLRAALNAVEMAG